ncbi:unnamed protein product, partial [Lampetra planeri]
HAPERRCCRSPLAMRPAPSFRTGVSQCQEKSPGPRSSSCSSSSAAAAAPGGRVTELHLSRKRAAIARGGRF